MKTPIKKPAINNSTQSVFGGIDIQKWESKIELIHLIGGKTGEKRILGPSKMPARGNVPLYAGNVAKMSPKPKGGHRAWTGNVAGKIVHLLKANILSRLLFAWYLWPGQKTETTFDSGNIPLCAGTNNRT
jgi:hypothetical protein